jgi:glucose/arabinose dehydrogenase
MPRRLCTALLAIACSGVVAISPLLTESVSAAPKFHGSMGGQPLNAPIRTIVRSPGGAGYYLFGLDGGVFAFGDARFRGSMGGTPLNGPIVDGALSGSGKGYYMVGLDGGVFAFGDAPFRGSMGGKPLAAPVVGLEATGNGYVMLGRDGGLFAFGSVRFAGSAVGRTLGVPAVGLALRPQGDGYWILLADGRIFAFGNAPHLGDVPKLFNIMTAIEPAPDGNGYLVIAQDGAAFAFGSAKFHGSAAGARLQGPMVDVALTADGDGYWMLGSDGGVFTFPGAVFPPSGTPALSVSTMIGGVQHPWDLGFLPDGSMVFTERPGRINALVGGQRRVLATPGDVRAVGEGGMTGLAIDPDFANNRRIYTCFNVSASEIQIVVWTIDAAITAASRVGTLLGGLPANTTGRHSGCRPRVGPDGFLWVGTGDAAQGTNPQNVNSLGGKVLRIDRFSGAPAPGNPFGKHWYTRGHRNVQGLAFRPTSALPYSVEHGSDRDDEVNKLVSGGNYGWNPVPGYNESVPMTFAGGIPAVWRSGAPTIATSGATFLSGPQWRDWDGRLAVAALKGNQLRIMELSASGDAVISEVVRLTGSGRLRTPIQGPDGALYVTTSNGGNADVILRVAPS